ALAALMNASTNPASTVAGGFSAASASSAGAWTPRAACRHAARIPDHSDRDSLSSSASDNQATGLPDDRSCLVRCASSMVLPAPAGAEMSKTALPRYTPDSILRNKRSRLTVVPSTRGTCIFAWRTVERVSPAGPPVMLMRLVIDQFDAT